MSEASGCISRAACVRGLVQATAPRDYVQHARNPARSVVIGGRPQRVRAPITARLSCATSIGGRRYGTIEDFRNFVKLDLCFALAAPFRRHGLEPVDLPVNKRHFDMLHAHMRRSDKPFMGSVTATLRAEDSVAMARILFGERLDAPTDGRKP